MMMLSLMPWGEIRTECAILNIKINNGNKIKVLFLKELEYHRAKSTSRVKLFFMI